MSLAHEVFKFDKASEQMTNKAERSFGKAAISDQCLLNIVLCGWMGMLLIKILTLEERWSVWLCILSAGTFYTPLYAVTPFIPRPHTATQWENFNISQRGRVCCAWLQKRNSWVCRMERWGERMVVIAVIVWKHVDSSMHNAPILCPLVSVQSIQETNLEFHPQIPNVHICKKR